MHLQSYAFPATESIDSEKFSYVAELLLVI